MWLSKLYFGILEMGAFNSNCKYTAHPPLCCPQSPEPLQVLLVSLSADVICLVHQETAAFFVLSLHRSSFCPLDIFSKLVSSHFFHHIFCSVYCFAFNLFLLVTTIFMQSQEELKVNIFVISVSKWKLVSTLPECFLISENGNMPVE